MSKTEKAAEFIISAMEREGFSISEVQNVLDQVSRHFGCGSQTQWSKPFELKPLKNLTNPGSNCPGTL